MDGIFCRKKLSAGRDYFTNFSIELKITLNKNKRLSYSLFNEDIVIYKKFVQI